MENNTSLANKPRSDETLKRRESLIRSCMAYLATGLGVEISAGRVALYLRPLGELSENQIKQVFRTALAEYKPYGGSFPSPSELTGYLENRGPLNDAPQVLARDAKPEGWAPISPEEMAALRGSVATAAGNLAMDRTTHQDRTEVLAAARNGVSKVPADPALRREYELSCLRKNDWIEGERMPGEEGFIDFRPLVVLAIIGLIAIVVAIPTAIWGIWWIFNHVTIGVR